MQDAHDVVGLAPPQRHAGVGRVDHFANDFLRRQIGVDEPHLGAMHHDVGHRNLGELEQAAEHVALFALDAAFAMQDVDRAHQLFVAGDPRILLDQRHAAQTQEAPHQRLDRAHDRTEDGDEEQHQRRDQKRHAVGIGDGDGLGRHLAEDDDQRGHDEGRRPNPALAVEIEHEARGDRRRADGDELAAEQHGADEPAAHADEAGHQLRPLVARHLERVHARAGSGRQRGLGAGEERRSDDADRDDDDVETDRHGSILAWPKI